MEVILALTVVCHLINCETVHNVLHLVETKLQHPMQVIFLKIYKHFVSKNLFGETKI